MTRLQRATSALFGVPICLTQVVLVVAAWSVIDYTLAESGEFLAGLLTGAIVWGWERFFTVREPPREQR